MRGLLSWYVFCARRAGTEHSAWAIGFRKHTGKLVFVEYTLSLRASAHTGVAIPLLRGEMYRKVPGRVEVATILGGNRYLVPFNRGIATTT